VSASKTSTHACSMLTSRCCTDSFSCSNEMREASDAESESDQS
jgi:hypothetical protein